MILGLIVVGNNSPSRGGQPAIKQEQKSQGKINGSDSEDIACHSHVLERERTQGILDIKNTLLLNIIFQNFMWDTSGTQS